MIQNVGRMRKQYCMHSDGNQTLACAFKTDASDDNNIASTLVVNKVKNMSTNSAKDSKNDFTRGRIMF